jgi:hypothetical protein
MFFNKLLWKVVLTYYSHCKKISGTYYAAIIENKSDFEGRVVVDVGSGSGILSLFAAQVDCYFHEFRKNICSKCTCCYMKFKGTISYRNSDFSFGLHYIT